MGGARRRGCLNKAGPVGNGDEWSDRPCNADPDTVPDRPDVLEKLDQSAAENGGGTARRFGDFMTAGRGEWAQAIKTGNVAPDS